MTEQEVLAFPRALFAGFDRFLSCSSVSHLDLDGHAVWIPRSLAEQSGELIQPIPCAVIRNAASEICVFRRTKETRADLRSRITLLVGGHVDRVEFTTLSDLLRVTLLRELEEEVGITKVSRATPIGIVVDALSVDASRHIAFVYEVKVEQPLRTLALEEFSARSKFSGRFFAPAELERFHRVLDPWSSLLFEDFINPSCSQNAARQLSLSLPADL